MAISVTSFAEPGFWIGVGILAGIYGIFTLGVQLNIGFTGIYNFGQIGFMGIGAYGMGILVAKVGLSFWLALPLATVVVLACAVLLGLSALRLQSHYLAIATIVFAEIVRYVAQNARGLTGGTEGLLGYDGAWQTLSGSLQQDLGLGAEYALVPLLVVSWVLFLVIAAIMYGLQRSPWGRVIRGIREEEDAVRSLAKNVFAYKIQSLAIASVAGAISGYLLALDLSYLHSDEFLSTLTFVSYAMLIVGGLNSFVGVVLGAVVVEFVLEATRFLDLPLSDVQVASLRFIIVGLVLIGMMVFRPQGLLGNRQEMVLER